jgi:hypothetical protein
MSVQSQSPEAVVRDIKRQTRKRYSAEVIDLKKENDQLKALVAELSLKNRVVKKSLSSLEPGSAEE